MGSSPDAQLIFFSSSSAGRFHGHLDGPPCGAAPRAEQLTCAGDHAACGSDIGPRRSACDSPITSGGAAPSAEHRTTACAWYIALLRRLRSLSWPRLAATNLQGQNVARPPESSLGDVWSVWRWPRRDSHANRCWPVSLSDDQHCCAWCSPRSVDLVPL